MNVVPLAPPWIQERVDAVAAELRGSRAALRALGWDRPPSLVIAT